jgi:hypothetical protein
MSSWLCRSYRALLAALTLPLASGAREPEAVALPIVLTASSQASPAGDKYAVESAFDGETGTHWASLNNALPQTISAEWAEPVTADTAVLTTFAAEQPTLYAAWKRCELRLDGGQVFSQVFAKPTAQAILRFATPQTFRRAELQVLEVFESRTYVGLSELSFYRDPDRLLAPLRELRKPLPRAAMTAAGRPEHPCVYLTPRHLELGRRNAESSAWGKAEKASVLSEAERWLQQDEAYWLAFLPEPGACYAYGFTGCPLCGSSTGTWSGARCAWDKPRQITCGQGHVLPDETYKDDGTGYKAADGRFHYLVGSWNAWVTEQWTLKAIPSLAYAYTLTGEVKYAERAAFFLDALASIYAESTAGSWDYPSSPPSGRFARPWYQVARTLVVFVEAYDLIYSSAVLDQPSRRPARVAAAPPGPTAQQRAVGTPDVQGSTTADMTRRQNIDLNLMIDAAQYCYEQTFHASLNNGHADYLRGALAVGALLGIEPYVDNAVDSPCSIRVMLANNADRDGRYFETALGYAIHARELYLTFVEPLLYWRSAKYPSGINLFDDARMRSFYLLPALSVDCAGHAPNFGDAGPDNAMKVPAARPFSDTDAHFAEWLYAYGTGEHKQAAAQWLAFLGNGDITRLRANSSSRRWLLYRADDVPSSASTELPTELAQRVNGSWVMGQKGMAILRNGSELEAQAVLLRYGPSLNHGDRDDLGLLYYARGWQMTYDIGYGLGSTHAHVGWAAQTVSHCLVTVDETSQSGGSGGSLNLFAELPSLRLIEAESPLSYANRKVSQYRRTVALIGAGKEQVLVDLFRVRGGTRHDYTVGVQTQDVTLSGAELGPEEDGSLAGKDNAWGELIGLDGDLKGYPNKPYWNPPPQNGYGFFYDPRRAPATGPLRAEFALGAGGARFRVHALPEPGTEAVVAKAPGLYPHNRSASYLILRRQSASETPLASAFAVVMEPYGGSNPAPPGSLAAAQLQGAVVEATASQRFIGGLEVIYLGGSKAGDAIVFELPVPADGVYRLSVGMLRSPSYGSVQVAVDGKPLGEPFALTDKAVSGPQRFDLGALALAAGPHRIRFETCPGVKHAFGVSWIALTPPEAPTGEAAAASPVLDQVSRVPVGGEAAQMTPIGVRVQRAGRDEFFFSASPEEDSVHQATLPCGELTWRGAIVFVALRDGRPETLATHGAWDVRLAGQPLGGPARGRYTGRVVDLDAAQHRIDLDATIPPTDTNRMVIFRNPAYSRDTAYRISGLTPLPGGGTRIDLGDQPVLLGHGRVDQVRPGNILTSAVPHEFGRSVIAGSDTRFFEGKRITNERGVQTTIRRLVYEDPMRLEVAATEGFVEGDTLFYADVSVGDQALIYSAAEIKLGGR